MAAISGAHAEGTVSSGSSTTRSVVSGSGAVEGYEIGEFFDRGLGVESLPRF